MEIIARVAVDLRVSIMLTLSCYGAVSRIVM